MATNDGWKIEITAKNLAETIHGLQLTPTEIYRAMRYAQLQAGKYARSQSRITFRERTRIKKVSRAKRRTKGAGPRAWLGANPIPIKAIAGLVTFRNGTVFVNNQATNYFPLMNVPGQPIYERIGKGRGRGNIRIVYANIIAETQQAADDVIPGTQSILQQKFMERAERLMTDVPARKFESYKGKSEDRLSALKYFRTTLR